MAVEPGKRRKRPSPVFIPGLPKPQHRQTREMARRVRQMARNA